MVDVMKLKVGDRLIMNKEHRFSPCTVVGFANPLKLALVRAKPHSDDDVYVVPDGSTVAVAFPCCQLHKLGGSCTQFIVIDGEIVEVYLSEVHAETFYYNGKTKRKFTFVEV